MTNRATAISVLFLVILSALAKDANGGKSSGSKSGKSRRNLDVNGAHVIDSDRELKGKSSKGSKGSKSRRALELHESELEFDEVELDELEFEGLFH